MKKSLFLIAFLLLAGQGFSQILDSAAVARQVDSLTKVSRLLLAKHEFDKALEANIVAEKAVLEKMGRESKMYCRVCFIYGQIYYYKGRYPEAEEWLLKAQELQIKFYGKETTGYANIAEYLGSVNWQYNNFEKAALYYSETKTLREKVLGKDNVSYGQIVGNLGNLYLALSQYEKAEPLLIESNAILKKTQGVESSFYAISLTNLSNVYVNIGNYKQAEALCIESKEIFKKDSTQNGIWTYSHSLVNLGNIYRHLCDYEKALPFLIESKHLFEKILGNEHSDYANAVLNLAHLYNDMGDEIKAQNLYLEAKNIWKNKVGKENQNYVESLNNLAYLYRKSNNFATAKPYLLESSSIQKALLLKATRHLSERELASYTHKFAENLSQTYSFASFQTDLASACYDNTLFHKGFLLNAATRINSPILCDSAATETFYRLKSYNRRLATEYTKPIADRKDVEELETKANDLEKDLARTVAGYGEALRQVKWQEVQAALQPGEAAIEFVHYRFWNKKQTDSTMYAALVLLPLPALPAEASTKEGGSNLPQFIPLFEEKQLESLLQGGTEPYESHIKSLYAYAPGNTQKSLYQLLWQPLESALGNTKTIYFSPSGLLHRLNLAAIPVAATATLADQHTLVELGSTRTLVVKPSLATGRGDESMLFGGIQYDMDSIALIQANAALPADPITDLRRTLSFSQTDSTLRGGSWKYLPGSEKEVADAEKIIQESGLRVHTLRGYAATEEAFKNIGSNVGRVQNPSDVASPRILHLATHGFFFPDPKHEKVKMEGADPVFKWSDNPLIRAGLILAGGNHAWKTGQPLQPGMDDGILTAYEISQMNLSNTELVVLSACETGLGDIQGNEGVYGLQRAFKIAGAKYVIMSLWQVPDKQTARLMTIFYKKWLGEKKTVPDAFRAAQMELRGRGFDPFYWAGFVLVE